MIGTHPVHITKSIQPRARLAVACCLLLALLHVTGCAGTKPGQPRLAPPPTGSPEAVAASVLESVGGQRGVDQLEHLHFVFTLTQAGKERVRREYWLNRVDGNTRMETVEKGEKQIALFNTKNKTGEVYAGNLPKAVENQGQALARVLNQHNGDAWWLLAATKLRDPEATLSISGAQMIEEVACPTLMMSYSPTSKWRARDIYWFHLDPATSRPRAWSFVLRGQKKTPATWLWKNWQQVGGAWLPTRFDELRGERAITIENLYSPGEMNPVIFQKP